MTDWSFPNFDRHLDPDLYDAPDREQVTHTKTLACRGCGHRGVEGEFGFYNGWPWCRETCHKDIMALAISSWPTPVTEDEAVEHFQQRRR